MAEPEDHKEPMTVYHAVVLQPVEHDAGFIDAADEDTIGIYTTMDKADRAINRYEAGVLKDDPEYDRDAYGFVYVVRSVELDTDLIYPQS